MTFGATRACSRALPIALMSGSCGRGLSAIRRTLAGDSVVRGRSFASIGARGFARRADRGAARPFVVVIGELSARTQAHLIAADPDVQAIAADLRGDAASEDNGVMRDSRTRLRWLGPRRGWRWSVKYRNRLSWGVASSLREAQSATRAARSNLTA
jgi:hypothetical protein